MPQPTIEMEGVEKTYSVGDTEVRALREIDLQVWPQDYISIMGPSGSGKSTLLYLIGCLDRPTRGSIKIEGMDTETMSRSAIMAVRRNKVGLVFQRANLLPELTALQNVELPTIFSAHRGNAQELLAMVGLEHRVHHKPSQLSVGEQQRVAIARALINDPLVILADEPTGNLDSIAGEQIMSIFDSLNAQGGSVVVVTHDPQVARHAKRRIMLKDGRIER